MTFYSGFCLKEEEKVFSPYHDSSDFCIAGFSLGAIDAFEYTLENKQRIDKLQLFSPAFFQEETEAFKKVQLRHFKKDKTSYVTQFLENCVYPSEVTLAPYYHESPVADLERLLYFVWGKEKLALLKKRGIMIEVYLGEDDKIVDTQKAKAFFQPFATIIMIQKAGHLLKKEEDG